MSISSSDNAMMAKVHCLYGKRLNAEDYGRLLQKKTIAEIVGYLKNETYFSDTLSEVKEDLVHREQLEHLVNRRTLDTYLRLIKYSYDDKLFFTMYRMKNEIEQILFAMRLLNAGEMSKFIVSMPVYLAKHLTIDLFAIAKANNYDDLLAVLERSDYYQLVGRFRPPTNDRAINIPLCETALLTYYYAKLLEIIRESYSGQTRENLEKLLYYQIDYQNVSMIYRMKRYFKGSPKTIASYIVNVRGKLSQQAYVEMLDAPDYLAISEVLLRYKAGYLFPTDTTINAGQMFFQIQSNKRRLTHRVFRFAMQPVVVVISYMTLLEIEAGNVINIIEGARYGLSPEEIRSMLVG